MVVDTATSRTYVLLGLACLVVCVCLWLGMPVDQILAILAALGVGGLAPSPVK